MLNGRANDIKKHKWFEGMEMDTLAARRLDTTRKPKESDSAKRIRELKDTETKTPKPPKESPEELQECEMVFADF
jgi:cGMP-dependent protein kinase 2